MMDVSTLFPRVERVYTGSRWSFYFLIVLTALSTGRSLVHIFAADGGSHSIAGIDIALAGGINIVALFAQWGASQLVLAFLQWLVVLRYRFLVPAMLLVVVLEQLLRIGAGHLKPLQIAAAPPGSYGTYLVLLLATAFFVLSLRAGKGPAACAD
jgi:hypothetical protein